MKKTLKSVAAAAAVVLALSAMLSGCGIFNYGEDNTGVSLATPIAPSYTKYKVITGDISISLDGACAVTSLNLVNYSFSYSGAYVEKVNVKTGQTVEVGTVLATLNTSKLQKDILNYRNVVAADQAAYDEAVAASGENSSAALKAKTTLEKDQQTLDDANTQLNNSSIKSTVAGVVRYINTNYTGSSGSSKKSTAGETIVGVDPLDMSQAYGVLTMTYDPSEYTLGIGSTVTLKKDATDTTKKITFTTTVVGSSIMNQGMYNVAEASGEQTIVYYLDMSNAPEGVSVGDNLSATYVEAEAKSTTLINADALYEYNGKTFVYTLDSQGLKQITYVEVGLKNSLFAQILSGVSAGDVIVLG